MHHLLVALRKRLPFLLPLLGFVIYLGFDIQNAGGALEVFGPMVLVCALIITMGIIVGRPFAEFISIPFSNIHFPNRTGTPELSYHLADYYLGELRYEDALTEYERLCHHHPRELTPWTRQIELLLTKFSDREAAESVLRKGRSLLRPKEKSLELQNYFDDLIAQLS